MKMKRLQTLSALITALSLLLLCLASCGRESTDGTLSDLGGEISEEEITLPTVETERHSYTFLSQEGDVYRYAEGDRIAEVTVTCESGTASAVHVEGNTISFFGLEEDSVFLLSGVFYGNIVAEGGQDFSLQLSLCGLTLTSYEECPIRFFDLDEATLSAKSGTKNTVFDLREEVGEEEISAAVYADCDLSLKGKGELTVLSTANNGIHTKDDLKVKNLTLTVACEDNALKGNDGVSVSSGELTLIARTGDGIKTKNSDLSKKGKQRGSVKITGGSLLILAARDGIDAAYNTEIDESDAEVTLRVYTSVYSSHTEESEEGRTLYLRTGGTRYAYSVLFTAEGKTPIFESSDTYKTVGSYRYYPLPIPNGYDKMQLFIYNSTDDQEKTEGYVAASDAMDIDEAYDTLAITVTGGRVRLSLTRYESSVGTEGNPNKSSHSAKGIKADNEILISAGRVTVKAYDDALHANGGETLENGETSLGDIRILGGTLTLYSDDDAIHGDGRVSVSDGRIDILGSYEGIEGDIVAISGGEISVISSDDGVNGKNTTETAILLSGGKLTVIAGGDGLDSNSRASFGGILFSGGDAVILSTGRADSAIDTEAGYSYTGGRILTIGVSGGMSAESQNSSPAFETVGTKKALSLKEGEYLTVKGIVTWRCAVTQNASVLYLGSAEAEIALSRTAGENLALGAATFSD